MLRLALALAVFLAIAGAAAAQNRNQVLFGAIAYSPETRTIGVAADNATQAEAESVALQNCRSESSNPEDCRVVMWVRNACAGLSVGDDGGWGTDWGNDRATAERKAMAFCSKYSQTCRPTRTICSGR